jgi:hypothetical protein
MRAGPTDDLSKHPHLAASSAAMLIRPDRMPIGAARSAGRRVRRSDLRWRGHGVVLRRTSRLPHSCGGCGQRGHNSVERVIRAPAGGLELAEHEPRARPPSARRPSAANVRCSRVPRSAGTAVSIVSTTPPDTPPPRTPLPDRSTGRPSLANRASSPAHRMALCAIRSAATDPRHRAPPGRYGETLAVGARPRRTAYTWPPR